VESPRVPYESASGGHAAAPRDTIPLTGLTLAGRPGASARSDSDVGGRIRA
jgi:hypothetical protein